MALPLPSIFLQETLLVVDEPQFRVMATTTQRPISDTFQKGSLNSIDRYGGKLMADLMNRRISLRKNQTTPNLMHKEEGVTE